MADAEAPKPEAPPRRRGGATFSAGVIVPFSGEFECGACGHVIPLPQGAAFPAGPACSEPKVIYRRVG